MKAAIQYQVLNVVLRLGPMRRVLRPAASPVEEYRDVGASRVAARHQQVVSARMGRRRAEP
ncbi:hypothetical protein GCM10010994_37040 [Chelatococcus reniformis]|uniref:Uncharacterized protein n=1 Tax=Chelatococcus reniformis TaxID=1494448 RepID=A0A916UJF9_9HYPH|nr:hypothetical protein GCM10010994_37040 [Chelatococcus reniformis]